jgi:hypothetical protein
MTLSRSPSRAAATVMHQSLTRRAVTMIQPKPTKMGMMGPIPA